MIDIHMHILPEIDDGARSKEEAVAMAVMAQENGIRKIIATSHGNWGELTADKYFRAFHGLQELLKEEKISVELYPGMEILMDGSVPDKLREGALLTLNGSRYVLVEFEFTEEMWMMEEYLRMLEEDGYIPVIAHAERYFAVQKHIEEVYNWARRGYLIQVNKGSLLGVYGSRERDTAISLLRHNLVHVVGTDAHGIRGRTPRMGNTLRFLKDMVSPRYTELVLEENPRRILAGEEAASFPIKPYRNNIYW